MPRCLSGSDLLPWSGSRHFVWLTRRAAPSDPWLGRPTLILAGILWAVAILHPAQGWDLPICWWQSATGLPCPGCGLMRSVSCTARGMMVDAWHYHPFGPIWLAVATAGAAGWLLPKRAQQRFTAALARHRRVANAAYAVLVAAFLMYGIGRALAC